ncbi:transmembrane protein [Ceratobasidium sp. AG-Ba]|nr:transmembrane protein [Ceratobasidium sp. AG-Ba]
MKPKVWLFTFTGSKASKYATELLELACGFIYEFPPELKNTLMKNWLCNITGLPGCWFLMDLMQEHNILKLKTKSQRRDEDFDGPFFQDVVSRNVQWFRRMKSVVNEAVHLQDRSNSHGSAKQQGLPSKHVRREICRILAPAAGIRHILAIPAPAPAPAAGMPVYRR